MPDIKTFTVTPYLPKKLLPLKELSYNLWFSWHPEVAALFRRLDIDLWEATYHNPILFLGKVSQNKLDDAARDEGFINQLDLIYRSFKRYMKESSHFDHQLDKPIDFTIAYFSAEYGISECLPIYSGGLGILSGDHLKSASDLNLPLVGMGLMYQYGFFHQQLNADGWQQESYKENDFLNMPLNITSDKEGAPLKISVRMKGRTVKVQIWRAQVGRISLYLLDTNLPENNPEDQKITAQLYGGDREMRLRQEIILGIGGVRALHILGIEPAVLHMNEGHSALASLERIRFLMKEKKLKYSEAFEVVYASNVFTTHTPVPAGNDQFSTKLIEVYLGNYIKELNMTMKDLLAMGRQNCNDDNENFGMTVLAIKTSAQINCVSKLHSEVSRKMWAKIWPDLPVKDIPIVPLTNGIHVPSWVSHDIRILFDRYLSSRWIEDPDNEKVWEGVKNIPDSELWRTHERHRERLVGFCRRRLRDQIAQKGGTQKEIDSATEVLNPSALTIGFARRFATYKRGDLLFNNLEKLATLLNKPDQPVQIIFAGKAHPADNPGKEVIKNIVQATKDPRFRNSIVFIEDYDINVARFLVQGVDVWLNTPQRPLEACGTSGMKAAANGALNLSVLDGWWCEAHNGQNGWAIGNGEVLDDQKYQNEIEADKIYDLLENELIRLFFYRSNDGLPRHWIARMKNSMATICPVFNTHRMLEEYSNKFYITAAATWKKITADNYKQAIELSEWKKQIETDWAKIKVNLVEFENHKKIPVRTKIPVSLDAELGQIHPDTIKVELYFGPLNSKHEFTSTTCSEMKYEGNDDWGNFHFTGEIYCENTGKSGFLIRILPKHELQLNPYQAGKILWI